MLESSRPYLRCLIAEGRRGTGPTITGLTASIQPKRAALLLYKTG